LIPFKQECHLAQIPTFIYIDGENKNKNHDGLSFKL